MFEVLFYDEKTELQLSDLPPKLYAEMLRLIDGLKIYGNLMPRKFSKAIEKDLFELRAKAEEGIARAFYTFKKGQIIIILHLFIKKSQKTPRHELEKARKILKELKCAK